MAKRDREQAITQRAGEDAESMREALCEEVCSVEVGGGIEGGEGGAVAICGNLVFAASNDSVIDVVDLDTNVFCKFLRRGQLDKHSNKVLCLLTVMDRLLFSGSMDNTICVWDLESMECAQMLIGHSGAVSCLALAVDEGCTVGSLQGGYVCSGSYDKTIRIWCWREPQSVVSRRRRSSQITQTRRAEDANNRPTSSAGREQYKDDGAKLSRPQLEAAGDGVSRDSWYCLRILSGHDCYVHALTVDGMTLYSAGENGLIKVWNVNTKHSIGQLEGSRTVYCLCLSKRVGDEQSVESILYSCGIDMSILAWNLLHEGLLEDGLADKDDSVVFELSPKLGLESLQTEAQLLRKKLSHAMTPEGRIWISSILSDIETKIVAASNEAERFRYVRSMQLRNGLLYSGGGENLVRIWNLRNRSCAGTLKDIGSGIHALQVGGQYLAMSCNDNVLRIFTSGEGQAAFLKKTMERENMFQSGGGTLMCWNPADVGGVARRIIPNILVRKLCCGSEHALLLDGDGSVWAWGSSEKGQTGTGDLRPRPTPTKVEFHNGSHLNFHSVAAGDCHSIAVDNNGTAWVFGDNSFGQLGIGSITEKQAVLEHERGLRRRLQELKANISSIQDEIKLFVKEQNTSKCLELQTCLNDKNAQIVDIQKSISHVEYKSRIYVPTINVNLKNKKILSAWGGARHTIFLSGECF